jgi:hypothetical protein
VSRAAAVAGLPASALIGIWHALERGRGGELVATALLGTVMAVAALCATAVFGASPTHLVSSPALYGAPFQVYFASDGGPRLSRWSPDRCWTACEGTTRSPR